MTCIELLTAVPEDEIPVNQIVYSNTMINMKFKEWHASEPVHLREHSLGCLNSEFARY